MNNNEFEVGRNGMPPVKSRYNEKEKKLIAQAAEKFGTRTVSNAYRLKWQTVVAWRRYHLAANSRSGKQLARIIIQSSTGEEVALKEILKKLDSLGELDSIYIRADENAAYWVKGEENGSITLW